VTRPDVTPLHRVLAVAELEAAGHGAAVRSASLKGLVPQSVLFDAWARQLRLGSWSPEQTVENALLEAEEDETEEDVLPRAFVDAVASDAPTPGGGSVAAVVASLGAALSGMVASLTIGQPKYTEVEGDMRDVQATARQLQSALLGLATDDSDAFEQAMSAYRLPRNTADEIEARREALEVALHTATQVPIEIMSRSLDALRLARQASERGNINAVGDAGVAGLLAHAAVQGASLNVATNVMGLRDLEEGDRYRREANQLLLDAKKLAAEIDRIVHERIKG
jgi:glutamate formiminotransferase/formiminotetrahydrofolate cyclodeaminase